MDGWQGMSATVRGCPLRASTVRLHLGAEGLDHERLGRGEARS